jgi:outer membrane protein assembly factor BamA
MQLKDVRLINFGYTNNTKDVNLCQPYPSHYNWTRFDLDFDNTQEYADLYHSNKSVGPKLNVDFRLLKSGPLRVAWSYNFNETDYKNPWTVPDSVLPIDRTVA